MPTFPRPRRAPLGPASAIASLEDAFPPPGHAMVAAGVVVASAALAALGLVAVSVATDEVTVVPVAKVRSGLAQALVGLATTEIPASEIPPSPSPPGPGPENSVTSESIVLSRISPPDAPPAPPGPVLAATRFASGQGESDNGHRLHRLSRAAVLKVAPFPALASATVVGSAAIPVVPNDAGALPLGTGMWLYVPEEIEGGNVEALVARARQVGLTHVYVRTGSSKGGFYAHQYMDELLPKAHAASIRVYGWDFPYLDDVDADVARAVAAITHTAPSGDRIDGFAADIETASEGTNLSAEGAAAYGQRLRAAVGAAYPLVAVVPRPSTVMQARYPYAAVIPHFDAVAPMTYWLNRQPDTDVVNDIGFLAPFGKPVLPIGQAYDGAPEGGRPGPPPPEEIQRFLGAAQQSGATGVSFWSWQHASQAIWDTLQAAPEFRWEAGSPEELRPDQVRALQTQLTRMGYPVAASGSWDGATADALRRYQIRAGLTPSAILDAATLAVITAPFNPPVGAVPRVPLPAADDEGESGVSIDLGLIEIDLPLG